MYVLPSFEEVRLPGGEEFEYVRVADLVGLLSDELREPIGEYLDGAQSLVATTSGMADPFEPDRDHAVPVGLSTDGTWMWPSYWGYFVREYGIGVPAEFIEHARAHGFRPPELSRADLERVEAELEQQFAGGDE